MKKNCLNVVLIFLFFMICLPNYALARDLGDVSVIGSFWIIVVILVVFFMVYRERVLNYWKINEILSVLKEIRDLLKDSSAISKEKDMGKDEGSFPNIKQDK